MRPGVDLVVVNYRTPRDLRDFLQSVEDYRPTVPFSLLVVNVDPTPEDEEVVRGLPIDYKQFNENVGFARAVNYGATFGDRETLAIFNADTRLMDSVVTDCHYALQSHPDWAILGPRQIDEKDRITHGGFLPHAGTIPKDRGFRSREQGFFLDIRDDAVTVPGSAYFIKREIWDELTECPIYHKSYPEAVGAFLPTPHYYEETWCSFHARAHGYKVVYYGAATMIHKWHRASPRGGRADEQIPVSREIFQQACEAHGIHG